MSQKNAITIWGRKNSVNVQKVMWTLDELSLEHTRIDAGMHFGSVKEPWYLAMNPNGRVPTMDDGGFILWESNTITRYLCSRYKQPDLVPADIKICATANQWMDWATSTMAPIMTPLFWGVVRTPPEKQDPKANAALCLQMESVMAILDKHLKQHIHLCGDVFSMGDIPVGCFVHRWLSLPMGKPDFEHIQRWYKTLSQRPAYQRHVMLPLS